jgi:hypothetical protein
MNEKKIVVLSSAYLPPVQYFTKLLMYDEIIIDAMEHYQKQSYRNRCNIYGANGLLALSIPLIHDNTEHTAVKDMKISNDFNWQKTHWHSIESAYRCSPFFEFYEDDFKKFYTDEYSSLLHFNMELLHKIVALLKFEINISNSLDYIPDYGKDVDDFRNSIHPKQKHFKPDPHFNPTRYIQVFENKYRFLPNLSIIDLLFCEGPHTLDNIKACIL